MGESTLHDLTAVGPVGPQVVHTQYTLPPDALTYKVHSVYQHTQCAPVSYRRCALGAHYILGVHQVDCQRLP